MERFMSELLPRSSCSPRVLTFPCTPRGCATSVDGSSLVGDELYDSRDNAADVIRLLQIDHVGEPHLQLPYLLAHVFFRNDRVEDDPHIPCLLGAREFFRTADSCRVE